MNEDHSSLIMNLHCTEEDFLSIINWHRLKEEHWRMLIIRCIYGVSTKKIVLNHCSDKQYIAEADHIKYLNLPTHEDGLYTLQYMAKIDNESKYSHLLLSKRKIFFTQTLFKTDYYLAHSLFIMSPRRFKSVTLHGVSYFYEWQSPRWIRLENDARLHLIISSDLMEMYHDILRSSDPTFENIKSFIADCMFLFQSHHNKQNIIHEFFNIVYDEHLIYMLDTQTHIMAFENCVLDFESNLMRVGYPTDYAYLSAGYNWNTRYLTDLNKEAFRKYFQALIPNQKERQNFISFLHLSLRGMSTRTKLFALIDAQQQYLPDFIHFINLTFGDYVLFYSKKWLFDGKYKHKIQKGIKLVIVYDISAQDDIPYTAIQYHLNQIHYANLYPYHLKCGVLFACSSFSNLIIPRAQIKDTDIIPSSEWRATFIDDILNMIA